MSSKIADLLKKAELQKDLSPAQSSVAHAKRSFSNFRQTTIAFNRFAEKLFYIKNWNDSSAQSSYELFDKNGDQQSDKPITVNDFIRISLKGTIKYDWVKIIKIYQSSDEVILTVQPSFDPTEKTPDESVTSHFFKDAATNNFCLERKGKNLNFYVIGLNEKTNTTETKNFIETIRNVATTNIGSYLGIQQAEWEIFCRRFLEIET